MGSKDRLAELTKIQDFQITCMKCKHRDAHLVEIWRLHHLEGDALEGDTLFSFCPLTSAGIIKIIDKIMMLGVLIPVIEFSMIIMLLKSPDKKERDRALFGMKKMYFSGYC